MNKKKEKLAKKNVQQGKENDNHYSIITILTESSLWLFITFFSFSLGWELDNTLPLWNI